MTNNPLYKKNGGYNKGNMKGKYCDYYWSVKKEQKGYVWYIRGSHVKGAEILESSKDNDDEDDKYFETDRKAKNNVYEAIQEYYS